MGKTRRCNLNEDKQQSNVNSATHKTNCRKSMYHSFTQLKAESSVKAHFRHRNTTETTSRISIISNTKDKQNDITIYQNDSTSNIARKPNKIISDLKFEFQN